MRLAWGRPVVFFDRNFDMECVSDQVRTALDGQIWLVVDMLAEQSARHRRALPNNVHELRTYTLRLRLGVNQAADSSADMNEHTELGAGRARARGARAPGAPLAHAGTHASAGHLPTLSRAHARQIYGLEGRRHIIQTGPRSCLGSCAARTGARDSRVPIVVHRGGSIHRVSLMR